MRAITLTFLYTALFITATAQEKNDLSLDGLKGKVRYMLTSAYKAEGTAEQVTRGRLIHTVMAKYNHWGNYNEYISSRGIDTIAGDYVRFEARHTNFHYDEKGNLIGNANYKGDGSLADSSVYKVDTKGNRVDWNTYKAETNELWRYTSEYDSKGNILETDDYLNGTLNNRHTYMYNEKYKLTEESEYHGDGTLKWKELFSYDAKGHMTEVMDYKKGGSFEARFVYKYDAKGNKIEEDEYKSEASDRHSRIAISYDATGTVTEMSHYDENGKLNGQTKLDKKGNHTSDITYNPDGSILEKVTQKYKYDEHGNETAEDRFLTDGSQDMKSTYKYDYDKAGNWTKKTTFEDGIPTRVTERTIEYY